jgi:hypothetical protein
LVQAKAFFRFVGWFSHQATNASRWAASCKTELYSSYHRCSLQGEKMKKIIYLLPLLLGMVACGAQSQPTQTSVNDTAELFSSDQLGLCFSYPQGYTQIPNNDTVEIVAPDLPDTDMKGLFWLEISDAYDRTAEEIADQDMTYATGVDVGRWTVTLGGEQAVVLDGMPGQDLQRRVYVVHQQTLYVLAFMPTRTENKAAGDQMETLYTAVTNSWAWSPCSASE